MEVISLGNGEISSTNVKGKWPGVKVPVILEYVFSYNGFTRRGNTDPLVSRELLVAGSKLVGVIEFTNVVVF